MLHLIPVIGADEPAPRPDDYPELTAVFRDIQRRFESAIRAARDYGYRQAVADLGYRAEDGRYVKI